MKAEIIEALRDTIRERHVEFGDVPITDQTDPETDLGIDSLEGIEITCELSKRLGIEIPLKENILVAKGENGCKRMRNVAEIAARLEELKSVAPQEP
jgi:acyl carrier protein